MAVSCGALGGIDAARSQDITDIGRYLWQDEPPTAMIAQRGEISLQQAIAMAQRQNPGRVVRAETKTQNGRRVHEIRILGANGRVRTIRINAGGGGR